ncbi:MAG: cupin domain-containing protein [Pseudomonadota bacterium]
MSEWVVKRARIDPMEGFARTHFLNPNAKRFNNSIGDLTGLSDVGFHIIEVEPGHESTEAHQYFFEDECANVLEGEGTVASGDERFAIAPGDFIAYSAGGPAHTTVR